MDSDYKHLFKLIIIGNSGVGKTCILKQYLDKTFTENHNSTIGVDFKIKTIMLNNETVKLQLWDTAGQEHFSSITRSYYRGSNGILVIFDLTNLDSFIAIDKWLQNIMESADRDVEYIFIGNKVDLKDEIVVTDEMVDKFFKEKNISKDKFYRVSAKENIDVELAFHQLTNRLVEKSKVKGSGSIKEKILPGNIVGRRGGCC